MSAPNINAVITANSPIAMRSPPETNSLMLAGHRAEGRTNHATNENRPSHGEQQLSALGDGVTARPKAVCQITPTMR
jgi:hypothetical protein